VHELLARDITAGVDAGGSVRESEFLKRSLCALSLSERQARVRTPRSQLRIRGGR